MEAIVHTIFFLTSFRSGMRAWRGVRRSRQRQVGWVLKPWSGWVFRASGSHLRLPLLILGRTFLAADVSAVAGCEGGGEIEGQGSRPLDMGRRGRRQHKKKKLMEESVIVTKQGGPLLPGGSFAAVMPPSHHYVPTTVLSSGYRFAVSYIRACVFVCMRCVPLPPSPHATFELKSREFFFVQPDGAHTHGWPTFFVPSPPLCQNDGLPC